MIFFFELFDVCVNLFYFWLGYFNSMFLNEFAGGILQDK